MLGMSFCSKLDWSSCIVSMAKIASKKIGAQIRSMKFLFPEIAHCLYKLTVWSCMECCYQAWVLGTSCYLDMLDKLQKWVCRAFNPSLAASLEPLAHHQKVASSSLFFSITQVYIHLNWLNWFTFFILVGIQTRDSNRLHN